MSIIAFTAYGIYAWKHSQADEKGRISYTAFIDKVNSGEIVKVRMEGDAITAEGKSGATFKLFRPMDAELSKLLLAKHIDFSAKPPSEIPWMELGFIFLVLIPLFFIMKRLAVFGKSKAKPVDGSGPRHFSLMWPGPKRQRPTCWKRSTF